MWASRPAASFDVADVKQHTTQSQTASLLLSSPLFSMVSMEFKKTKGGLALQKLDVDKENVQNRSRSNGCDFDKVAEPDELSRLRSDLLNKDIELNKINDVAHAMKNQLCSGIQQPIVLLGKKSESAIVKQLVDVLNQLPESRGVSIEQALSRVSHLEATVSSFESLQKDTMSCMGDMTLLLGEKDAAIANLLSTIDENEQRLQLYQSLIGSFLREKAVIKGQLRQLCEHKGEDDRQRLLQEIKYGFILLAAVSVLTSIAYKREWFLLLAPLYFLFIFFD